MSNILLRKERRAAGGVACHHIAQGAARDLRRAGAVVHLFEGRDLKKLNATEALDFNLQQSDIYVHDQATTRGPSWNMKAATILRDFMCIDMWLAKKDKDKVVELCDAARENLTGFHELKASAESVRYNPINYYKAMETILSLSSSEDGSVALACYLDACNKLQVPGELTVRLIAEECG